MRALVHIPKGNPGAMSLATGAKAFQIGTFHDIQHIAGGKQA
jgi:hypothetical protein